MNLEYNDERHEYKINGEIVPSVTQVLKEAGLIDFSGIPPLVLENARERGLAVHETLELYDKDDLVMHTLDPVLKNYLHQWELWLKESGFNVLTAEQMVGSEEHMYAGTMDRMGTISGDLTIMDIKTSKPTKSSKKNLGLQLAGYVHASPKTKIVRRIGLFLTEDSFKEIEYDDKHDHIWWDCLEIAKWKKEK